MENLTLELTLEQKLLVYKEARALIAEGLQTYMCIAIEKAGIYLGLLDSRVLTSTKGERIFQDTFYELFKYKPDNAIDSWFPPRYYGSPRVERLKVLDSVIKDVEDKLKDS